MLDSDLTHTVPHDIPPTRLSDYGIGLFSVCMTKAALKKVLKKGWIKVDGEKGQTGTWIKGGEEITLHQTAEPSQKKQLIFPLKILLEDDYLAVIHKPAGILVSGNGFMTITNALPQNLSRSSLPDATAPQPIHRLDYATTGALLIGKTTGAIRQLSLQFQQKHVEKTYYAVAIGEMPEAGTLDSPIDGKEAITHFEKLDSVPSPRFTQLNLLKIRLETGRRHQIRKHLSELGNHILGDKDYGLPGLILNGKGMYLHAYELSFTHHHLREAITVCSKVPKRFIKLFPSITS